MEGKTGAGTKIPKKIIFKQQWIQKLPYHVYSPQCWLSSQCQEPGLSPNLYLEAAPQLPEVGKNLLMKTAPHHSVLSLRDQDWDVEGNFSIQDPGQKKPAFCTLESTLLRYRA